MLRNRTTLVLAVLVMVGCGVLFVVDRQALAAAATSFSIESIGDQTGLGSADLRQIIINIIRWALGILTLVAVVYMMYGGYIWLTAAGNEQRVEKAKQVILQAAIGLVIVLMAWAIVLFIVRTTSNVATNNGAGDDPPCLSLDDCIPDPTTTFNIAAVTTCAVGPAFGDDVPRSSAVSLAFNTDLRKVPASAPLTQPYDLTLDPMYLAVTAGKLKIEQCTTSTCAATESGPALVPSTLGSQVYTPGETTAGTQASPKAEWVAIHNTLTFYHLSFTDGVGNNFFKENTTYRLTIPKGTDSEALIDIRNRVLSSCHQDNGDPIVGDPGFTGNGHCDDTADDRITYTFTTGDDTVGQPMTVVGTAPSSEYKTKPALYVDRNVPRSAVLAITFSSGIDPITATTANFRVYKIVGAPDDLTKGTCGGGECTGAKISQVDPAKFEVRTYGGSTAYIQFKNPAEFYEPFTWYQVVAENFRNLCGTTAPRHFWAFETNNETPGVDFVYPYNEFAHACPTTQVFAQFRTSMWDITKGSTCEAFNDSSYMTKAGIWDQDASTPSYVTTRDFDFSDKPPSPSSDPNGYCKRLSFDPASAGLDVGHTLSGAVKANRPVDIDGTLLNYGDAIASDFTGGIAPWHFTIKPADQCAQPPYISQVSPGEDKNGACVSVIGNYFEKVNVADTVPNQPDPGDTLTFGSVTQGATAIKSWTSGTIVNKLDAGSLAVDQPHDYRVGVSYPAPIGQVLQSNAKTFMLRSGGPDRPCLYNLNPSEGPRGTRTTATGENFGPKSGSAAIESDNHGPWTLDPATGSWTTGTPDTVKDIVVPATATQPMMSQVWVVNAAGTPSNRLNFNVRVPPGTGSDIPAVVQDGACNVGAGVIPSPNPYRDDAQACANSEITVRFTLPIEPSSVVTGGPTPTMALYSCAAGPCTDLIATTPDVSGITVKLLPTAVLSDNTPYEVRITTGVTAALPPVSSGKPLGGPYSWRFTTKAGACAITNVALAPSGSQTVTVPNYTPVGLAASAVDDACHTLAHPGLQFDWQSTNTAVGEIKPDPATGTTDATKSLTPPPAGAALSSTDVTVTAQSHTSNTFTLTYNPSGPGGTMAVIDDNSCNAPSTIPSPNPYRDDALACRNSEISVRFTQAVDPTTVVPPATSVELYECPAAGPCTGTLVPTDVSVVGNMVTLAPSPVGTLLNPSTRYEVRISTALQAAPPPLGNGKPLAAAYSWQFTTKSGTANCVIDNVTTNPTGLRIVHQSDYTPVAIQALTIDNACHTLTHAGLTFDWSSSNHAVGVIQPPPETGTGDAKALVPPAPVPPGATAGLTDVNVKAESHTSPNFSLRYDPTACVSSSDCTTNSLGESCGGSTCNAGHCTPVINALDQDNGPIGSWTTIKGCWFGPFDAAKSKVVFSDEKQAVIPNPVQCGSSTWTNERIIREVPNLTTTDDAITGPVRVERNDGVNVTSSMDYQVTSGPLEPGLCKVNPVSGPHNALATVTGRGFTTKAASDNVTFTPIVPAGSPSTPVTLYPTPPGWKDTEIPIRVPIAAADGANDVRVVKGAQSSNSTPFTIDDGTTSCVTRCFFGDDSSCGVGNGCSYPDGTGLGCCAPRPRVSVVAPPNGSSNQCRNTTALVTFDQTLDSSTINKSTVRYLDGSKVVDGSISHTVSAGKSTILYNPGVVRAGLLQRYLLSPVSEVPVTSLKNPSFDVGTAASVPVDWPAVSRGTQSSDLAPGQRNYCLNGAKAGASCAVDDDCDDGTPRTCVIAHSGFVDCKTDAACTQAFIAQTLPEQEPVNTQFHVTGWVKVEAPAGVSSGLITQCIDNTTGTFGACGYDQFSGAAGLYTGNSNGWQRVDMIIKKTSLPSGKLHINCFANDGAKAWCDDVIITRINDEPTYLRSQRGVLADISYPGAGTDLYDHSFTVGADICTGDHVGITPVDDLFLTKDEVHPDSNPGLYPKYLSYLYPPGSTAPISPVSGKYEFSWSWATSKAEVAKPTVVSPAVTSPNEAKVTAIGNGTANITATAKVTLDTVTTQVGRQFSGASNVAVRFCVNPWNTFTAPGFTDSSSNCDALPGGPGTCGDYNFKLFYCRDGATLLPNFNYIGLGNGELGSIEGRNDAQKRLKSYFFKESSTSRDVIGLQVFANDNFLSPYDWFHQRFPSDTSGSSTTVAGYPAVRSGTATYIGVTNFTGSALQGLLFVIDYNSNNASPETVAIFNQMLETMVFNTNVSNAAIKQQLINDTRRRQDMMSMKILLDEYRSKNGTFPTLAAGSYIAGFSTSKWPSWQSTLGAALGKAAPTDPRNTFLRTCSGNAAVTCVEDNDCAPANGTCSATTTCQPPYENATCWAESTKTFTGPSNSFIYAYRQFAADRAVVYGQMEYTGTGTFATGGSRNSINACTGLTSSVPVTSCPTFNFCLEVGQTVDTTCTHP